MTASTGQGVSPPAAPAGAGFWRRAKSSTDRILNRLTLAQRFALFCLVIFVSGALLIGQLVAREIQNGVVSRTGAVTALYVDSVLEPHLRGLATGEGLSAADVEALEDVLFATPLGQQVVSIKIWTPDGTVVFATDESIVGMNYGPHEERDVTLRTGEVLSHISDLDHDENAFERQFWSRLVETYSPVRGDNGEYTSVVEFYHLPDALLAEIDSSQQRAWAIVGGSTIVMYVLLVGLVTGASRTITRQTSSIRRALDQQVVLERRIRGLNQRLRRAAAQKAETDEEILRRIAQDLHDGPAQDLALALLRFDALQREDATQEEQETLDTLHFAVRHALEEMRDISTDLNLPKLDGLGWREIVEKAVSEHRRRTGVIVFTDVGDVEPPPNQPQRIAAYRLVQEALSNATRYSGTSEHRVALRADGGWVVLAIEDRGVGFNVAAERNRARRRAALGLLGMRERVELLGGEFSIVSAPGEGTRVTARIPLVSEQSE